MLDIRQRTGYLFLAVTLGHVILISAQVQSKSGVGVLASVTLGAFARVQQATASVVHGVRDAWGNYVDLRGVRAENETLRSQVADLEVRLQEQRALAARTAKLQELLKLRSTHVAADACGGSDCRQPQSGHAHGHDRSRIGGRRAGEHGGHRVHGRGGARRRSAGGACRSRAAHHRPPRRSRSDQRAGAGRRDGGRPGRSRGNRPFAWSSCRTSPTSRSAT